MKITILNWEKYNVRKDVKAPTWFRFNHKLFEDSDFYDFTHSELITWVYLLCECSKQNKKGVFTVNAEHAHRTANVNTTVLESTIKKLQRNGIIEARSLRGRYVDVQNSYATLQDKTEQDKTRQNKTEENNTEKKEEETLPSATTTPTKVPAKKTHPDTAQAVASFCQEYKRRYGVSYRMTGRDVGTISRMVLDVGLPTFEKICAAYVDMPDPWFLTKRHDVLTLESSFAKVSQYQQSGRHITRTEINQVDLKQANSNVFDALIAEAEQGVKT